MKNTIHPDLTRCVTQLLNDAGIPWTDPQQAALQHYMSLIQQWNPYVSLVSIPDLEHLYERHVVDALSLVPLLQQQTLPRHLLDIGSGGGFPAIPIAIALPDLSLSLLERSFKKIGFLRKVVGALQLNHVELVHGVFPQDLPDSSPTLITARAVEKPALLTPAILDYLPDATHFLCQSGYIHEIDPEMFHVEPVEDIWQEKKLRRGSLHRITRR